MNYNKVILMGNLTKEPKLSYLSNNAAVVELTLAINHKFKRADGQQGEDVCFVDCQMFGKRAEVIKKHIGKGDPLLVEGRLRQNRWEKDGKQFSRLKVLIESFEFVGSASKPSGQEGKRSEPLDYGPAGVNEDDESAGVNEDDDLPF